MKWCSEADNSFISTTKRCFNMQTPLLQSHKIKYKLHNTVGLLSINTDLCNWYQKWNHTMITDTAGYVFCHFALYIVFDAQEIQRQNVRVTHSLGGETHAASFKTTRLTLQSWRSPRLVKQCFTAGYIGKCCVCQQICELLPPQRHFLP